MKTHVVMTGRERLFAALNGENSDHVPVWLPFPYHPTGFYVNVQTAPGYRDVFETTTTQAITLNRRNLGVPIHTPEVVRNHETIIDGDITIQREVRK